METRRFSFDLPEELIAQHPPRERGTSRLMLVERSSGRISHHGFQDLPDLIPENVLMVFNNARVRKARIFGTRRRDGGESEFLFLEKTAPATWQALAKPMKKLKAGNEILFPDDTNARVIRRDGDVLLIGFETEIGEEFFEKYGVMPLPPYIHRPAGTEDDARYQTVYAADPGAAAAPTAGLHFTEEMLSALTARGIERAELTLHVGIGTFLPIRAARIEDHVMHEESFHVSGAAAAAVTAALQEKRPIVAVGTTCVRALESGVENGALAAGTKRTSLYIRPGYTFKAVSHLLTNFHTPESSLLVMVSAFAGYDLVMRAYREAVAARYRFFSYGDAMLIV